MGKGLVWALRASIQKSFMSVLKLLIKLPHCTYVGIYEEIVVHVPKQCPKIMST